MVLVGELSNFPFPYLCAPETGAWSPLLYQMISPSPLLPCGLLDPSLPRSEQRIAPTSRPQERCRGQAPGELVTQAATSKHVPPPPLSAGRRRFVHGDAESPQAVPPFRL